MKKYIVYQIILLISYIALIMLFSYMSIQTGSESSGVSQTVADNVATVEEKITGKPVVVDDNYILVIRKVFGHGGFFVLFGIVSSLLFLSLYTINIYLRISIHYVAGIFYAFISEFLLEASTVGRTPSFSDVLLDSIAFVGASTIVIMIYFIIKHNKKRKEELA